MDRRDDDEGVDREAPTPKTTGSFAVFYEQSMALAKAFGDIALIKEKVPTAYDRKGAEEARELAHELTNMAKRFAMWPQLNPETVAMERAMLVARLIDLTHYHCEVVAQTPGATLLGSK
jgi:hypothetical protein